jgi:hypothetical protein
MSIEATHGQALTPAAPADVVIHPLWVRLTHWVNFLATAVMIGWGWEIYPPITRSATRRRYLTAVPACSSQNAVRICPRAGSCAM